ncbi:MAG: hypothetical protein ACOVQM_14570 [Pirellula sp.]
MSFDIPYSVFDIQNSLKVDGIELAPAFHPGHLSAQEVRHRASTGHFKLANTQRDTAFVRAGSCNLNSCVGLSAKGVDDRNPLPAHWLSTQMGVHEQPEQILCLFEVRFATTQKLEGATLP